METLIADNLHLCLEKKKIINGISLRIDSGTFAGIIGRNGSGKTSLLRMLSGYYGGSGKITAGGRDLSSYNRKQLARIVSVLTQTVEVIDGITGYEIIKLGDSPYTVEKSEKRSLLFKEICSRLQIESFINCDYSILSRGQKQLIQIARVLYQNTKIIFLDEPDNFLDLDNRHRIMTEFRKIASDEKKILLAVLHDPVQALTYCDIIYLIDNGRISDTVYPRIQNCDEITALLNRIYPGILIRYDDLAESYYCIFK